MVDHTGTIGSPPRIILWQRGILSTRQLLRRQVVSLDFYNFKPTQGWFICALAVLCIAQGCSRDERKPRAIRGHLAAYEGVSHGRPAARANRYCTYCHGEALGGGANGEPSCFQCHGAKWSEDDTGANLAPSDHSLKEGDYFHNPGFDAVVGTCDACHGPDLQGDTARGTPSCLICHDKNWE